MITRNGQEPLFAIEGTVFLTDQAGMERLEELRKRYIGKPRMLRPKLSQDVINLLKDLQRERRLYRQGGERL